MSSTEKLEKTYTKVSDMLKYSEAKNISIIAINSAIFVFYATVFKIMYSDIRQIIGNHPQEFLYFSSIFLLFSSSFVSLLAILPKYVRIKRYRGTDNNYIFYADICKIKYNELLEKYNDYEKNEISYEKDLAQSIVAISLISSKKNNKFSFASWLSFSSIGIYFLFYINSIKGFI